MAKSDFRPCHANVLLVSRTQESGSKEILHRPRDEFSRASEPAPTSLARAAQSVAQSSWVKKHRLRSPTPVAAAKGASPGVSCEHRSKATGQRVWK